jgi:hypothetical protein
MPKNQALGADAQAGVETSQYAYPLDAGRWIFRGIDLLLNGFSVRISSQPASNG